MSENHFSINSGKTCMTSYSGKDIFWIYSVPCFPFKNQRLSFIFLPWSWKPFSCSCDIITVIPVIDLAYILRSRWGGTALNGKCCRRKWGFQKVRGRLRREVGRRLVGCYSVYITQTFTVIYLIDHALYTHIIKPLNIIIVVWTKSVKVALLEKSRVEVRGCRNIHLHLLPRTVSCGAAVGDWGSPALLHTPAAYSLQTGFANTVARLVKKRRA